MGRLTPLYAGKSAADRKRKERAWAYRNLFGMCEDLAALVGGDGTYGTDENEDDSAAAMNTLNAFMDDDDEPDSRFNRRLAVRERIASPAMCGAPAMTSRSRSASPISRRS
jgi:hypothetical protein